ncbi:MAG: hypothetical protein LUG18_14075 [Candidatus Azobacteroides sp.]|nr:hypothetical protein [Candidatus Azobacteroides sp.]
MENAIFLQEFLAQLKEKFPQETNLVNPLADILLIEKASIYRRLRGEVPFAFSEVVMLSQKLDLSLDQIVNRLSGDEKVFLLPLLQYVNSKEDDYHSMERHMGQMELVKSDPKSELTDICNVLPATLFYKYEFITRFYMFKWMYQYGQSKSPITYKDIFIEKRLREMQIRHYKNYKNISTASYIFDNLIFYFLINNLKYFASIYLITPEEIEKIKKDLLDLLSEIEETTYGCKNVENNNQVLFYVSQINFDTNYLFINSTEFQLLAIKVFLINYVCSDKKEIVEEFMPIIQSLKRHSILISGCNERERILFFEKQRKYVEML